MLYVYGALFGWFPVYRLDSGSRDACGGSHSGKGAKYTKSRRPVTLAYYEVFENRQDAMRREYAIKQLPKKEKERLAAYHHLSSDGNVVFMVTDILVSRTDDFAFVGQFFDTMCTPSGDTGNGKDWCE